MIFLSMQVCRIEYPKSITQQFDIYFSETSILLHFVLETYCFIPWAFIRYLDIYCDRYAKMVEWMDNVEMAIQKVCASKVYTSAEFKREKDNFQSLCKNLERAETKK